jgi:hypothetical protein
LDELGSDNFIQARYKEPQTKRPYFVTTRVEPDLAQQILQYGGVVTGQIESTFLHDLLSWLTTFAGTVRLLQERKNMLEQSARLLLEKETFDEGDLRSFLDRLGPVAQRI